MNRITRFKSLIRIFTVACFTAGIVSHAQDEKKTSESRVEPQIGILVEYYELDHRTANKLMREYSAKAADAQGLRDALCEMVEKGDSALIETAWLRARSGQRAKTESIRETIYPTEYDPPQIPNTVGVVAFPKKKKAGEKPSEQQDLPPVAIASSPADTPILMTSATPTAFETRNVGATVEVDPVLSKDGEIVTVSIAPEMVTFEGMTFFIRPESKNIPWGADHISMPLFYSMQTALQLKAQPGNYNLLGMFTPPNKPEKKVISLLKVDLVFAN